MFYNEQYAQGWCVRRACVLCGGVPTGADRQLCTCAPCPSSLPSPSCRAEHFGRWFGQVPEVVISPCCSEFMVTRAAVQALPRAFYEETIAWIDTTSVNTGWMFEVRDPSGGA